jgi:hypothetical protein
MLWDGRRDFWRCRSGLTFGSRLLQNRVQFHYDLSLDRLGDPVQVDNRSDMLEGLLDRLILDCLPVLLVAWTLHGSRVKHVNHCAKSSRFALAAF